MKQQRSTLFHLVVCHQVLVQVIHHLLVLVIPVLVIQAIAKQVRICSSYYFLSFMFLIIIIIFFNNLTIIKWCVCIIVLFFICCFLVVCPLPSSGILIVRGTKTKEIHLFLKKLTNYKIKVRWCDSKKINNTKTQSLVDYLKPFLYNLYTSAHILNVCDNVYLILFLLCILILFELKKKYKKEGILNLFRMCEHKNDDD